MAANAPPAASRNAWLSVGAPILGLVLLVSLFALLLLLSFARQQDKDYANGSRQLVSSALDGRAHAIASLTIDYANWDDAYQNISRRFSRRWLERVFYSSVTDAFVVFQRGHAPRFVWFKDEASPGLGAAIARTASKAPNLDSLAGALEPPDGVATAYAVVGGRLAVIGIAPVTPENNARRRALAGRSNTYFLAAVRFLDPPQVATFGRELNLTDLHFSADAPAEPETSQALIGDDGERVGYLTWTHTHPGRAGLMSRLWIVALGLAIAGLMTIYIARLLVMRHMASLVQAEAALEASRHKSEFIATMSHELRTPLNAIIGYAELIEEEMHELPGAAVLHADVERIIAAGRQLSRMVTDVLDQSRLDAGKLQLQIEPVNVQNLVAEVVEIAEPLLIAGGSRIEAHVADGLPLVMADHARLRQCLLNLAGNAARFTQNGLVSLSAGLSTDGAFIVIDVTDRGVGLSEQEIALLFMPFAQESNCGDSALGGVGLGLAISRKLARAMGGDIFVTSQVGKGTTFSLRAPAAPANVHPLRAA